MINRLHTELGVVYYQIWISTIIMLLQSVLHYNFNFEVQHEKLTVYLIVPLNVTGPVKIGHVGSQNLTAFQYPL